MTKKIKQLKNYWFLESNRSFETATILIQRRKYPEALFFGHLSLEKILKAIILEDAEKNPLPIHDLTRLAQHANLLLSKELQKDFEFITSFNIAGRYDDEKRSFYKKCTPTFAKNWFKKITHYHLWLKKEFQTK